MLWLHSLKVAQLLRSAASLHTNQSRSYWNHLVFLPCCVICNHSVLLTKHRILWKIRCLLSSFSATLKKWFSVKRCGSGGGLDCCGLRSGQDSGSCECINKPSGP